MNYSNRNGRIIRKTKLFYSIVDEIVVKKKYKYKKIK